VDQVLGSAPEVTACYKMAALLQFYTRILTDLMTPSKTLPKVLLELSQQAMSVFFNQLNVRANSLLVNPELPPADLGAPADLEDALDLLKKILSSKDSYADNMAEQMEELNKIFKCMLDPMIQMCTLSASNLAAVDMAVYISNCAYRMRTILSVYENTEKWMDTLQQQIATHIDVLAEEQTHALLSRAGLKTAVTQMQAWESEEPAARKPLSTVTGLQPQSIREAMTAFDVYLAAADFGLVDHCELLVSPRVRNLIQERSLAYLVSVYGRLHTHVTAADQGYTDAAAIMPRTPDQIKSLLNT